MLVCVTLEFSVWDGVRVSVAVCSLPNPPQLQVKSRPLLMLGKHSMIKIELYPQPCDVVLPFWSIIRMSLQALEVFFLCVSVL